MSKKLIGRLVLMALVFAPLGAGVSRVIVTSGPSDVPITFERVVDCRCSGEMMVVSHDLIFDWPGGKRVFRMPREIVVETTLPVSTLFLSRTFIFQVKMGIDNPDQFYLDVRKRGRGYVGPYRDREEAASFVEKLVRRNLYEMVHQKSSNLTKLYNPYDSEQQNILRTMIFEQFGREIADCGLEMESASFSLR